MTDALYGTVGQKEKLTEKHKKEMKKIEEQIAYARRRSDTISVNNLMDKKRHMDDTYIKKIYKLESDCYSQF